MKFDSNHFCQLLINNIKAIKSTGTHDKLMENLNSNGEPHKSRPGTPTLECIKKSGELAYQRAIFNNKSAVFSLNNGDKLDVKWSDLELPVTFLNDPKGKDNRKRTDLIGVENNKPFLCELKYVTTSRGDSPISGIIQLLIYYYHVMQNANDLDEQEVFHKFDTTIFKDRPTFKWKNISRFMIFAANEPYWNWHLANKKRGSLKHWLDCLELENRFGIKLHLMQTNDASFIEQKDKAKGDCYTPSIDNLEWIEVI